MDWNNLPKRVQIKKFNAYDDNDVCTEVQALNVGYVLEHLFPTYWTGERPDYFASRDAVKQWCEANGAHFYQDGREDFSFFVACEEAVSKGLKRVVYEDLS